MDDHKDLRELESRLEEASTVEAKQAVLLQAYENIEQAEAEYEAERVGGTFSPSESMYISPGETQHIGFLSETLPQYGLEEQAEQLVQQYGPFEALLVTLDVSRMDMPFDDEPVSLTTTIYAAPLQPGEDRDVSTNGYKVDFANKRHLWGAVFLYAREKVFEEQEYDDTWYFVRKCTIQNSQEDVLYDEVDL